MNIQTSPSFSSSRTKTVSSSKVFKGEVVEIEQLQPVAIEEQSSKAAPNVLIVSASTELSNRIASALRDDADELDVSFETASIQTLAQSGGGALSDHVFGVFEVNTDNDLEMAALRELRKIVPNTTRFLAVTAEAVTLATAKMLMEVGFEEVLPIASVRDAVSEAPVQTGPTEDRNGIVVAITKTRGGLGATSTALNLAALLSRPSDAVRARVAVVDLDFQNGTVGAMIDVEPNGAYMDLLKGKRPVDSLFVSTAMLPYLDKFEVLPAPQAFAPLDALTEDAVKALLEKLRKSYDYVILDLPAAIVSWIEAILAEADQVLMITDTSVSSVRQARRLIDLFREEYVSLPIKMIVSKEKQPFRQSEALKEATSFLELPFEHWLPRDDRTAQAAMTLGQPMVDCAKRCKVTKPLGAVVAELNALHEQPLRRRA